MVTAKKEFNKNSIKEFIKELKSEGLDLKQIADFLCDGEALAARGITDQSFVEECYDSIINKLHHIKEDLKISRYVCKNCGYEYSKKMAKAFFKNGFALWHLSCPECGEQTIAQELTSSD